MPSSKDSPPEEALSWRRFLIAAGTARYDYLPEEGQLPSVEQDLEQIRKLFCNTLLYQEAIPDLRLNPQKELFRTSLGTWIRGADRDASDAVVIYYSGHGDIEGDRHYLLTADSKPDDLLDTAVPTEDLARRIGSSSVQLALLLIDTCYAGYGSGDIATIISGIKRLFSKDNAGVFVIAAARPKEEAKQGVFTEALVNVFNDPSYAGERQPYIWPTSISTAINRYFRAKGLSQRTTIYVAYSGDEDPPFFPNPRYKSYIPVGIDLEAQRRLSSMDPADLVLHWGPRARGVEIEAQLGWYFTGRTRVLSELVQWLTMPARAAIPQVITGRPGAGKSAVLARLVTLADPDYRRYAHLEGVDPTTIPPERSIDIAIHAKGKTVVDIVKSISRVIDIAADDPDDIVGFLKQREQPLTIVIDALDEAKEPETIARRVLQPLTSLPSVRMLIGTRREPISSLGPYVEIKHLDEAGYHDPQDIVDYVECRLLAQVEPKVHTPYRGQPELARRVAEVVAERADPIFLIARLICENLIQAEQAVNPQSVEWRDQLPTTVAGAFSAYLARFGTKEYRVRDLLLPLAYAEGEGLPWEYLWAPLASALSRRTYTDDDVAWVLDTASSYIVEALESGRSVYRLYHKALADFFHDEQRDRERHRLLAETLAASIPKRDEGGNKEWREAHPYVLQHLSTHAAAGGVLSDLMHDPLYLLTASPTQLLLAIERSASVLPQDIVSIYKQSIHRMHNATLEEKASYLELNTRKQGMLKLANQIESLPLTRKWSVRWARWKSASLHRVLEGHTGLVSSVMLGRLGARDVVVSSGNFDKTIRIWDAGTGEVLRVLEGHTHSVNAVVLGRFGERDVIVSGSDDKTIRVWEPQTGEVLQVLEGHVGPVTSVVLGQLGGRDVIVSGGSSDTIIPGDSYGKTVHVWEPQTGEVLRVLEGHVGPVNAVVLGRLGERDVIVSGSDDRTIRVWEPQTGEVLRVLEGHTSLVNTVVLGRLGERDVIVSGSFDKTIRIWEAETGKAVQVLEGHTHSVNTVVLGRLGERDVIVSGSHDETIRIWEAETGKAVQVLEGHANWVWTVAVGRLGERDVVVSGSYDGTIRIWEAETGAVRQVLEGHTGMVFSVKMGRLGGRDVVVSGSYDGTIRIWEAETGAVRQVLEGHTNYVHSVVLGRLGERDVIVSGSFDRTVRVWDPMTAEVLQVLEGHTNPVNAVVLGRLGGRDVVVSGSADTTIRIWEAETGEVLQILEGHISAVHAVVLGRLAEREVIVSSGDFDKSIRVWEPATGKTLQILEGHTLPVSSAMLGQLGDRDIIVSGSYDKTVRVWDVGSGTALSSITIEAYVHSIALKDNCLVVGTRNGIAMLQLHRLS